MVQVAYADAKGIFRACVPPGAQFVYIMGFSPSTAPRYVTAGKKANVTVGEATTLNHDFTLTPAPVWKTTPVRGVIVGPDGSPVPYASVNTVLVSEEGGRDSTGGAIEADANGAFVAEGVTGSVRLRARSGALATDPTTLAHGGERVTLHIKPNVLTTLSGTVIDEQGKPIFGSIVALVEWWRDTED